MTAIDRYGLNSQFTKRLEDLTKLSDSMFLEHVLDGPGYQYDLKTIEISHLAQQVIMLAIIST